MKILFYIESLSSGGKERRLIALIKGLLKYSDIEIVLVLMNNDIHYSDIFDTKVKIQYTVRKRFRKDPTIFLKFYKIAKKIKPDIIHVWGNMPALYSIPTKILLKIPLVNSQITNAPEIIKHSFLGYKASFYFSDIIISNSQAGLKSYNAPIEKSIVIYNGFDFSRTITLRPYKEIRSRFGINTKYVIGMFASFSPSKDYETYIKAAKIILQYEADVTFLCVGPGDDTKYRQLANNSKIKFLGVQKDVESIMNSCDIGVLATFTEGISNSVMEFMALGKPVIATRGGGTEELVVNNETGLLVKPRSELELAQKIKLLIQNKDFSNKLGYNAKERITNVFSIDKMTELFMSVYRNLTIL